MGNGDKKNRLEVISRRSLQPCPLDFESGTISSRQYPTDCHGLFLNLSGGQELSILGVASLTAGAVQSRSRPFPPQPCKKYNITNKYSKDKIEK